MTGAFQGRGPGATGIPSEHLAELGVGDNQVLHTSAGVPDRLLESHLEAWSYTPDFTGLVQILLEHLQTERNLSIAVCGSPADARARAHAALQLSIGLTQHGRSVAVVDADATLPGLAGLIADPHTEGLIDMVRFGRSCRSLLWKPLQTGPAVLPLGSFPLRGRLPFDADAVRGVLHRVALHTDVALYVAPLVEGEQLHPIVHACGQVVHVQGPEAASRGVDADLSMWVMRGNVRVVGLVFHDTEPAAAAPPAAAGTLRAPDGQPLEVAGASDWTSRQAAPPRESAPPSTAPKFDLTDLEPALDALEPQDEQLAAARPSRPAGSEPDSERADLAERSPGEAAEVRERLRLGETEFAYDEKVSYSRTPLYLLITLIVLIGGFLGWVVWTERGIERRQLPAVAGTPAGPEAAGAPAGEASITPADPDPGAGALDEPMADDAAAASVQGGADPSAQTDTQTSEATEPPRPATPPTQALTQTPTQTQPGTPPPAAGGEPTSETARPAPTRAEGTTQPPAASRVAYSVHVASYQRAGRAQSDVDNLQKHGFEARFVRTDLGSKGIWYRVYVGSYPSRAAADQAREAVLKLPEYSFAQVRRAPAP